MTNSKTSINRFADGHGSKIVHEFLETYFYERLKNTSILGSTISSFETVTDVSRQVLGLDTIVRFSDHVMTIDEKAALRFMNNRNLNSFAFELLFKQRDGKISDGWFIDKKQINSHFLVIYLRVRGKKNRNGSWINGDDYLRVFKREDIVSIEAYLLERESMHGFLEKLGIGSETLRQKARTMHDENVFIESLTPDLRLQNSGSRYREEPVNLLFSKKLLRALASHCFTIQKDALYCDEKRIC